MSDKHELLIKTLLHIGMRADKSHIYRATRFLLCAFASSLASSAWNVEMPREA